jgi:hypothetical protein
VYATLDCLHWGLPGTLPEEDRFLQHPQLQELNWKFSCNSGSEGKFASPFHPQVRQALVNLVREIAARQHPPFPPFARGGVAGIALKCRLSLQEYLSYSEATRIAFIRAHRMDPIDIALAPKDPDGIRALQTLTRWRKQQVTDLVGEISRAFKEVRPDGKVAAFGYANLYRWQGRDAPSWLAEDWLSWAVEGHLDELILEGRWTAPENRESYALAYQLLQKAGAKVAVTPMLVTRDGEKPVSLEEQLAVLQQQAPVKRVLVQVSDPADGEAAWAFLGQPHAVKEVQLAADFPLDEVTALQTKVRLHEPGIALAPLAEKLSAAAGKSPPLAKGGPGGSISPWTGACRSGT